MTTEILLKEANNKNEYWVSTPNEVEAYKKALKAAGNKESDINYSYTNSRGTEMVMKYHKGKSAVIVKPKDATDDEGRILVLKEVPTHPGRELKAGSSASRSRSRSRSKSKSSPKKTSGGRKRTTKSKSKSKSRSRSRSTTRKRASRSTSRGRGRR